MAYLQAICLREFRNKGGNHNGTLFSKEPIFPLDKYDGKQLLRGVINGVECFSNSNWNDYPLTLSDPEGKGIASLEKRENGWGIEIMQRNGGDVPPSCFVYLESVTPVPLPLGLLGITEIKKDEVIYGVSVVGTRLILTDRKPS